MSIVFQKLKDGLPLNKEEQEILKKEYSSAKLKIFFNRFSMFLFFFLQIVFIAFILVKFFQLSDNVIEPIGKRISVLPLDKPIDDKYADEYVSKLIKLNNDKNVKAIIVSLRSPGGTPSASWRIADVLSTIQTENKKPIYTYVESAAVSGSYMIASQSNKIYSNPFAIVGSIGVIIDHLVFDEFSKKVGFKEETLTTGEYKKVLSTFSLMNEKQKKYLKDNLLNKSLEGFIDVVAEGRKIDRDEIKKIADGRIFIANDNRIQGILIDKVIGWSKFKKMVYNENNISSKDVKFVLENVKKENVGLFNNLIGSASFDIKPNIENNLLNRIK